MTISQVVENDTDFTFEIRLKKSFCARKAQFRFFNIPFFKDS